MRTSSIENKFIHFPGGRGRADDGDDDDEDEYKDDDEYYMNGNKCATQSMKSCDRGKTFSPKKR